MLFCLFSLPVITAGASLCALCEGMQLIASDRDSDLPVFKTFLKTFKKSFVSATLLWFVCIFCYFILVSVNYAAEIFKGKGLGTSYTITYYALAILLIFGYQNLFPSLARWTDLKVFRCVKRSYQVAVVGLPWTVAGIIITVLFAYLTLVFNRNFMRFGMFLWAVCGFGIVTYLSSFLFLKAADSFEKREQLRIKEFYKNDEDSDNGQ